MDRNGYYEGMIWHIGWKEIPKKDSSGDLRARK